MKKCIVISTAGAKFSALAIKGDFKETIKKAAELGYDAVELAIRDPRMIDVHQTKNLLRQHHLIMPAIGTGQAYGEEGLSFTDPDPEIRKKAVQRIKDQIDLAVELGQAQVIIGLIRGAIKPGVDPGEAEEWFIQSMVECLGHKPEVTLTLEPLNRYETNLYNDTGSARAIIDKIGRPNLRMLIDTFHMNIEEPDIVKSILDARDHISHVHFADSNRWAPGCGHINFREILDALLRIGYQGAISAEILPKPTPEECLRLTIEYYKKLNIPS
ncbi:MAG: 5-keto-L-gluconate epimerase [Thermodesulfobacteriota bacterium]